MPRPEAHIYFLDTIGMGDWFYGTTLSDVRYIVEGWAAYEGGRAADNELPAKVVLHFPACQGGDVVEGYGIYNYLRDLSARGVAIESRVEGYCASIATLVALAADTVLMADAALWMVHKPSTGGCNLNADDMAAAIIMLDKVQAQIVSRYVARTGMDAATANELVNRTSTLNADECLALGFITGKLADAPLVAPVGADAVLNYFPTTKPNATMALTPADETRLVDKFINAAKSLFAPKNEAPAPEAAPIVAMAISTDVTGGDPIYTDGELIAGSAVYSDEAMTIAYADGDYDLADGRAVTVLAGMADEIAAADTAAKANAPAVTNSAELETALAEIVTLKAENAAVKLKVTGLTNKLKAAVPGSAGAPTKAGAVQNIAAKPGESAAAESAFKIRKF